MTSTGFRVAWTADLTPHPTFQLTLTSTHGPTVNLETRDASLVLSGLEPGTLHRVEIVAQACGKETARAHLKVRTGNGLQKCYCHWFSLFFLGLHLQHMEIPRLGVESELQPPASTTATAPQDPSHICKLHHGLWPHRIPNPLSKAKDRTCGLLDTRWGLNLLSHNRNSHSTGS